MRLRSAAIMRPALSRSTARAPEPAGTPYGRHRPWERGTECLAACSHAWASQPWSPQTAFGTRACRKIRRPGPGVASSEVKRLEEIVYEAGRDALADQE